MKLPVTNSNLYLTLRRERLVKLTSLDLLENKKKAALTKRINRLNIAGSRSLQISKVLAPSGGSYLIAVRVVGSSVGDFFRDKLLTKKKIYPVASVKSLYPLLTSSVQGNWLVEPLSGGALYLVEFSTLNEYLSAMRAFIEAEKVTKLGGGIGFEIIFAREEQNYIDFRALDGVNSAIELRTLYSKSESKSVILLELCGCLAEVTVGLETAFSSNVLAAGSIVSSSSLPQ